MDRKKQGSQFPELLNLPCFHAEKNLTLPFKTDPPNYKDCPLFYKEDQSLLKLFFKKFTRLSFKEFLGCVLSLSEAVISLMKTKTNFPFSRLLTKGNKSLRKFFSMTA